MPIDFNCPGCGRNYKVAESNAGKKFACKDCGKPVEVPSADTVLAAPPVTASPSVKVGANPAKGGSGRAPRLPGAAGPKAAGGPRLPGRQAPMGAPGAPRPYGQQPGMMGPQKTSAMAITSLAMVGVGLVLFVAGLVIPFVIFLSLLCPLAGLICGIVGMVQTKKGGRYKGFGMALAGVIVNGLGLFIMGAFILFAIILVASVTSDPNFQRQLEEEQRRQRERGYRAPVHRSFEVPAHQRPEWALFP